MPSGPRPAPTGLGPVLRGVVLLALAAGVLAFTVSRPASEPAGPVSQVASTEPTLGLAEVADQTGADPEPDRAAAAPDLRPRLWSADGYRLAAVRGGSKVELLHRPRGELVARVGSKTEFGSRRVFSVLARRGDWLRVATEVSADNRPLWVRADRKRLSFETTQISIHANLTERTVELHEGDRVLHRLQVTIGAPGSSTPTGRFAVTDTFVGGLNPVYGCCAIALSAHQPELPSDWIGGDRVAIHGTTGPVGNAASSGCLRAADSDMQVLIPETPPGAPVFISR